MAGAPYINKYVPLDIDNMTPYALGKAFVNSRFRGEIERERIRNQIKALDKDAKYAALCSIASSMTCLAEARQYNDEDAGTQ